MRVDDVTLAENEPEKSPVSVASNPSDVRASKYGYSASKSTCCEKQGPSGRCRVSMPREPITIPATGRRCAIVNQGGTAFGMPLDRRVDQG